MPRWRVRVAPLRRKDPDVAAVMAWVIESLIPALMEAPVEISIDLERIR